MAIKNYFKIAFWSALIGTIAGLFLAKKPGGELRQDIKTKGQEFKNKVEKIADRVGERAKETVTEVQETWEEKK
jgi:gas vesicle protein